MFRSQIFSSVAKQKNCKLIWVEQNTYYNRTNLQWLMMRIVSFRVHKIICTSLKILEISKRRINQRKSILLPNPINTLNPLDLKMSRSDDLSLNTRMHFIGDGNLLRESKSLSVELGIASKCVFHGDIPLEKMFDVLNSSKVLVSTSTIEGFGLARLEALSSGCCVISTDTGGVKDYLSNLENIGIFIMDSSIENISKFMYRTLNKDFWSSEIIRKRMDKVSTFSPSVISKKWLSV